MYTVYHRPTIETYNGGLTETQSFNIEAKIKGIWRKKTIKITITAGNLCCDTTTASSKLVPINYGYPIDSRRGENLEDMNLVR